MNKSTMPSKRVSHNVFIEEDGCLLEIKRNNKFYIYEIDAQGSASLITQSILPYQPEKGKKAEDYYLDYLSASLLHKIDVLTTVYDYSEMIQSFKNVLVIVQNNNYSYTEFSMDMAYVFEDYKDIVGQLFEFTGEDEYLVKLKFITKFFDEYFYEKKNALTEEDIDKIKKTFILEISFLESLSSN